jgi:hypothetical protein
MSHWIMKNFHFIKMVLVDHYLKLNTIAFKILE